MIKIEMRFVVIEEVKIVSQGHYSGLQIILQKAKRQENNWIVCPY